MRIFILIAATVALLGCSRKNAEYQKGYACGVAEAKAEIANSSPTLYASGTQPVPLRLKDENTGLPVKYIAGCIVNDTDMGRQDGHNKTVLEHLKKENP